MIRFAFILTILVFNLQLFAQRKMENLGRGLVAVRKNTNEVFISWRIYGLEYKDSVNYNLYRGETLIASDLSASNYVDNTSTNGYYQVEPFVKGTEQKKSVPVAVTTYLHGSNSLPCIKVPIKNTPGYTTQCLWVGDLDGDGEYDFVLCKINWDANTPVLLEAYTRQGDFLWKLDCGPNSYNKDNISPGSSALCMGHGDNVTVYDINNDGFAEVIVRTADGVTFGDGKVLEETNNNKQFVSVLEGTTGKEIARAEVPEDFISVGPLNGHMGIAYLDGINPSVVYSAKNRRSDKGFNMAVTTWNWRNDSLVYNWKFVRDKSIENEYPDGHNIRIIDVDGDGKDEITPMCYTLDDDGKVLYSLAAQDVYHGDRFFIGDMDPAHEGLEGYGIQQGYSPIGIIWYYYDAKTGQILQEQLEDPIVGNDYARGFVGDLDPRYPGFEFYTFTDGLYNVNGSRITTSKPDSYPNLRIWWDGDLLSENLDNRKMTKWDYIADIDDSEIRLYTFNNIIQDPRKTPAFYGDILGDWREEAVYASDDGNSILIFSTVTPTSTRLYTLPHNPGYRNCFTVRGYYQSHMLDYYLGNDMTPPPAPNIEIIGSGDKRKLPEGFFFIKAEHSGLYLDTVNRISQQQKEDSISQVWSITRVGELYEIYSMGAGMFLSYLSDTAGSELVLADSAAKELFRIIESDYNQFIIASPDDSTMVISIKDSSMAEGGKPEFEVYSEQDNQQFGFYITADYLDCNNKWKGTAKNDNCGVCCGGNTGYLACSTMETGLYRIMATQSGLCFQQSGDTLTQGTCNETGSQIWEMIEIQTGSYYLLNVQSKKYLNFDPDLKGSDVVLENTGKPLRFEKKSDSAYFIKSQENPGFGCQAYENSLADGARIILGETRASDSNTYVFERYAPTIIENPVIEFKVECYPNPVIENIFIELPDQFGNRCFMILYDGFGNQKLLSRLQSDINTIDLKGISSGIYYAKIVSDKQTRILKIIKQ